MGSWSWRKVLRGVVFDEAPVPVVLPGSLAGEVRALRERVEAVGTSSWSGPTAG